MRSDATDIGCVFLHYGRSGKLWEFHLGLEMGET